MKSILSLLIILSLSSFILNVTINNFEITAFKPSAIPCDLQNNKYVFLLVGTFSEDPLAKNTLTLDLKSPANGKAECVPIEGSKTGGLTWYIDISKYPLTEKIEINPVAPDSEIYSFENFDTFLKDKTIDSVCNIFSTTKVEDKGCSDKKNSIKLSGDWTSKNVYPILDTKFELGFSNDKKTKATCEYKANTPSEFDCLFEGGGKVLLADNVVKFNEKFYFKFNKFDSDVDAKDCSKGTSGSNFIGLSFAILLLNILLF